MKKLALFAAAAIILVPSVAAAQTSRGGGGHHGGGGHGPRPGGGHHGGGHHGGGWNGGHGGGWGHHGGYNGGFHRGGSFGGFAFGGFFSQPQYHVQNWQLYGFVRPQAQQRWVRYYDDAYLVDHRGYIHDARRGLSWDRYGERWDRDDYGIPYYVGRGDYHPDRRDYRDADRDGRWSSGWDYDGYGSSCGRPTPCGDDRRGDGRYDDRERRVVIQRRDGGGSYGYEHGGARTRTYVTPGHPAPHDYGRYYGQSGGYGSSYGYGSGYGYGYGHGAGTVVVTETTVTPGEQIVTEEIIEEVVEEGSVRRHRATPRRHAAPPRVAPRPVHRPAPRPAPRVVQPRGERG